MKSISWKGIPYETFTVHLEKMTLQEKKEFRQKCQQALEKITLMAKCH